MNQSQKRVSINIGYGVFYLGLAIVGVFLINNLTSEYKEFYKYLFIVSLMLSYSFCSEKIISLTYKRFGLEENDKEDFKTLFNGSKRALNMISIGISSVVAFVVFTLLSFNLIFACLGSIFSFFISYFFVNLLIVKSFED